MQTYDKYLRNSENKKSIQNFREAQKRDIDYSLEEKGKVPFFRNLHKYTTTLPPLHCMPEEFRRELSRVIIDLDTEDDLNAAKVINWCKDIPKVFPVQTSADGNCLLHAVSQALWGIGDEELLLRGLLYVSMCNGEFSTKVKRRWLALKKKEEQQLSRQLGVDISEQANSTEWENIKQMAGGRPSTTGLYPFLEAAHIYTLANILRRPIIIYSERMAESIGGEGLQENCLGGIYLPLEWDENECFKYPLALTFHLSHFTPLMFREEIARNDNLPAFPLVSHYLEPLIIHFLLPHEEKNILNVLQRYLKIRELSTKPLNTIISVLCAEVKPSKLPNDYNSMISFVQYNEARYRDSLYPSVQTSMQEVHTRSHTNISKPNLLCSTPGCSFFADQNTAGMCSKCFLESTKKDKNSWNSLNSFTPNALKERYDNKRMNILPDPSAPPPSGPITDNFIDISLMGEKCHNNCGLRCSTATFPYCHECYQNYVTNVKQPGRCGTSECSNLSRPGQMGLCDSCYNKKYGLQYVESKIPHMEPTKVTTAPNEIPFSSSSVSQYSSGRIGTEHSTRDLSLQDARAECGMETVFSSKVLDQQTLICSNPTCNELAQRNEINMCSRCFLSNPKKNLISLGSPEILNYCSLEKQSRNQFDQPGKHSFINREANQSKSLPLEKKTVGTQTKYLCCIPGCSGIRLTAADNVDRCWACLNRSEAQISHSLPWLNQPISSKDHSAFIRNHETHGILPPGSMSPLLGTSLVESTPPLSIYRCVSSVCDNLVDKSQTLCNSCQNVLYQAQQGVQKHQQNPQLVSSGLPFQKSCDEIPDLKGKPCLTSGCDRFGDESQNGYCSQCFLRRQKGMIPSLNYTAESSAQNRPTGHDPATETLKRIENEMKGKKCRKDGCHNFGNSKSFGFCNKCYQEYVKEVTGKTVH